MGNNERVVRKDKKLKKIELWYEGCMKRMWVLN